MKNYRVLFVLALLSFALLAAMAFLIKRGPARTGGLSAGPGARENDARNTAATSYVERTAEATAQRGDQPFSWTAIESSDYKQYIANLRTIRCPEKTIRSIIIADVNKLYASRERAFKEALARFPADGANTATAVSTTRPNDLAQRKTEFELRKQLREVEEEKSALLKELLGFELPLAPLRSWSARNYERYEAALDALPADKRERARKIEESYWQISDQLNERHNFRRPLQFLEEYKQINANRKSQLAQVLAPEELEEFEMRTSAVASRLGAELREFKPTEKELRELFRLQQEMEEPAGGAVRADTTEGQNPNEIAQRRMEARERMKAVLGEERFAEFERAQDGNYRYLSRLGERYNLPKENILQAYQIQQAVNSQVQQLSGDPNQNLQQRLQAIQTIAAQNQDALRQLLGERAYKIFLRGNRNQIQSSIIVE